MACKTCCACCKRLVFSQSVTFTAGTLIINIPAGSYNNCEKYCLIVSQNKPNTTTINAPVVVTIGDSTTQYPLTDRCCAQVTACQLDTRKRYSTRVSTTPTGGTFRLLCNIRRFNTNDLTAIDGTAPAAPATQQTE